MIWRCELAGEAIHFALAFLNALVKEDEPHLESQIDQMRLDAFEKPI